MEDLCARPDYTPWIGAVLLGGIVALKTLPTRLTSSRGSTSSAYLQEILNAYMLKSGTGLNVLRYCRVFCEGDSWACIAHHLPPVYAVRFVTS